ncbi:hypothetical protein, partial [Streptococcus anginosus]|uniref:hypothetical protein n=1 Tax=Streptococcus anginosus TaxID=1328 RepID=UPI002EDA8173
TLTESELSARNDGRPSISSPKKRQTEKRKLPPIDMFTKTNYYEMISELKVSLAELPTSQLYHQGLKIYTTVEEDYTTIQ